MGPMERSEAQSTRQKRKFRRVMQHGLGMSSTLTALWAPNLYMTTLALLKLEVYYRHLPLYQHDRIEIPLKNPPRKGAGQ